MSRDPKNIRAEEKTRIVKEAKGGDKEHLKNVAKKYDLDVSLIETWIREKDVTYVHPQDHFDDKETVDLQVTEEFENDYEFGATPDNLNYNRLFFWTGFGTIVILLFIVSIYYVYDYTFQGIGQQSSESSQYYEVDQVREDNLERLNSFGIIDLEEGVYRIPIDSAITRMVEESE